MKKTRRRITYVDHRGGTPTPRTKQFFRQSDFDRALRDLFALSPAHLSVEEHVTVNIYPEEAGDLFDKGALL